jgi:hypothetical protein
VCKGIYGKEAFDAIKRMAQAEQGSLQAMGWHWLVTNRGCYGLVTLSLGGAGHRTLPKHHLGVRDFVIAKARDWDGWAPPADNKLEEPPPHPKTFDTWVKQARLMILVLGTRFGAEHSEDMDRTLDTLVRAHEVDDIQYPATYVYDLWEQLLAHWCEGVREGRRQLQYRLGTDNPRKEELRSLAYAPDGTGGTLFRFPPSFDLAHPEGYYMKVVIPQEERHLHEHLYNAIRGPKGSSQRVGDVEGGEEGVGGVAGADHKPPSPPEEGLPSWQEPQAEGTRTLGRSGSEPALGQEAALLGLLLPRRLLEPAGQVHARPRPHQGLAGPRLDGTGPTPAQRGAQGWPQGGTHVSRPQDRTAPSAGGGR